VLPGTSAGSALDCATREIKIFRGLLQRGDLLGMSALVAVTGWCYFEPRNKTPSDTIFIFTKTDGLACYRYRRWGVRGSIPEHGPEDIQSPPSK
jgi:hypothetical protein